MRRLSQFAAAGSDRPRDWPRHHDRAAAQWIVFDPNNYAQNVLTAARELAADQQPDHIAAKSGADVDQSGEESGKPAVFVAAAVEHRSSGRSSCSPRPSVSPTTSSRSTGRSRPRYAPASPASPDQALIANAQSRWQNSVAGLQDAMRVQATVVGNLDTNRTQMSALVTASQGATGALQASQAGNQLLALQAQQLADLTATVAAQGRAQSLDLPSARPLKTRAGNSFDVF